MKTIENGLFLTFEGPEGSGKSTQIHLLAERFTAAGYNVIQTREPGGTPIGEELRRIVKHVHGVDAPCNEAELLIFSASRAQLMRQVILPHLAQGGVVICDRFADSTTAYQGFARGWDMGLINSLHEIATAGRWPDTTFLLDIDIETSVRRRTSREENKESVQDRLEKESLDFHSDVRQGYLTIADQFPDRIKVVDASVNIQTLHQKICELVQNKYDI